MTRSQVSIYFEQGGGTPQVLQPAERSGGQHGPDQASAGKAEDLVHRFGRRKRRGIEGDEDAEQGSTLQYHLDLAEPVGAKGDAAILQEAPQTGDNQFTGDDQGDHPGLQPTRGRSSAWRLSNGQEEDVSPADQHLVDKRIQVASQRAGEALPAS